MLQAIAPVLAGIKYMDVNGVQDREYAIPHIGEAMVRRLHLSTCSD